MRCFLFLIVSFVAVALTFGFSKGLIQPTSTAGDVVNAECPVSGMPVKAGMEVETKDGSIGVCCGKCKAAVAGWTDEKKAQYVANYKPQSAEKAKPDAKDEADGWDGEPYVLSTCAASGRPIDVKGTPTTKVIEGRELKFCCGGCAAAVEKDPAKWLGKVDEAQTKAQANIYPTETCCVSGEPLFEAGTDGEKNYIGTDVIVKNRLFRVCCKMCAKKVKAEPAGFAAALNEMVMETQGGAEYVLDACAVNPKGKIDTESARTFVVAGRLMKTCCGSCEKNVRKDPAKYVAIVDEKIAAKRAKFAGESAK